MPHNQTERGPRKGTTMRFLPVIFLAGFFLELAVMIAVGQRIGILATILLIVAGGVLGTIVIRAAGLGLADAMRKPVLDRKFATQDAAAHFLLLPAGLLLILPGFVSDIAALALLPQPVRNWLAGKFADKVAVHSTGWQRPPYSGGTVIEGEAVEITGEIEPRRDD